MLKSTAIDSEKVNRLKAFLQEEGFDPKEAIEIMAILMARIATYNNVQLSELAKNVTVVIMGYHGEFLPGDLTRSN